MRTLVDRTVCNTGEIVQYQKVSRLMKGRFQTKLVRVMALTSAIVALGSGSPALAREEDEPPRQEDRGEDGTDDAPKLKRHGTLVGRVDSSGKGSGKSPRPEVLPSDVKLMIERFKTDREKFLKQQQEIERKLKLQDSKSERDALRNQLKSSLDKWKDQQKEFRDRLKERMKEIELPEIEDVVRSGKGGKGSGHGSGGRDRNDK